MIAVKVRTIGPLKALFGAGELEVTLPDGRQRRRPARVARRSRSASAARPTSRRATTPPPCRHLRIMVNGRDIAVLGGRQAVLDDDDEILMLTPVAGG